ncbi:MAG TPA: coenzyme F420-0:L-glutamate ligase [Candidatus Paceibacterota bacterium]|nr:coenzyme F420-0:L-glutamate ligase [Candidatus Paceibacterota bacterium]
MQVQPVKTRIFKEGESLADFVVAHIPTLAEGSVLVVTSKIVALAEGRTSDATDEKTKERLIRAESTFALKTKWVWLTLRDRLVIANAGIDESNSAGKLVLLPKDSYASAKALRTTLMKRYGIRRLGVILTDSRILPLRTGVMGVTLGYAGVKGLRDYIGQKDIFGRKFQFEKTNVVDCLASAAVLCMGEGAERQPLAVITGAPVAFATTVRKDELAIDLKDDIYLPLFAKIPKALLKKR